MFGKMGKMANMAKKYKKLQKKLSKTIIKSEKDGVQVKMSAESKVQDVEVIDEDLLDPSKKEDIEDAFKTAIQKAQDKAQEVAMDKTKDILGFDPSEMMGGGK